MRDSSLDRLNGAGDVQYKEPQTTLLAGSTSIHKRHGSTGIYDILGRTSHEEPLARGTLNSTARTISPAQTQLRWSCSLDSSSRRDLVALGNQLWLSVHPAVLLWHPSISEQDKSLHRQARTKALMREMVIKNAIRLLTITFHLLSKEGDHRLHANSEGRWIWCNVLFLVRARK